MLEQILTIKLSIQSKYTHTIRDIVRKLLDVVRFNEKQRCAFIIALGEALDNAVVHGNKMKKNKPVEVECIVTESQITCSIKDKGRGFDYKPLLDRSLEEFSPEILMKKASQGRISGLGLGLIRKCADEVSFNPAGNKITFTKSSKKR